jgi:hypothetical protein
MVSANPETCHHLTHFLYIEGPGPAVNNSDISDEFIMPLLLKVIVSVCVYSLMVIFCLQRCEVSPSFLADQLSTIKQLTLVIVGGGAVK